MGNPVRIAYGVSVSRILAPESQYPGLLTFLYHRFAVAVEGSEFSDAVSRGKWDGMHHFVSQGGRFPTGLTGQVRRAMLDLGYESVVDGAPKGPQAPDTPPALVGFPVLTPQDKYWFQWGVCRSALDAGRGVLKSPTGSGKTNIAALMIKCMEGKRVLFLVDSVDLLDQTAERFESLLGEHVSRIGDGSYGEDVGARVCVSTVQTLKETKDKKTKRVVRPLWVDNPRLPRKWLHGVDAMFLDECHLSTTDAFVSVTQAFKNAHMRFGLSATPFDRGDLNTMKLMGVCGDVVANVTGRELIELGILAEPDIRVVTYASTSKSEFYYNSRLTYGTAYDRFICSNRKRNTIISRLAGESDSVLILVAKKGSHGEVLYTKITEDFPDRNVLYLSGDSSGKIRSRGRKDFIRGGVDILIATPIFDKGIDLPNIRTLILAGGGKSTVNTLQRLGRGMRVSEGKRSVTVYDFLDDTCDYLLRHSVHRLEDYESEGYNLTELDMTHGE